MCAPVTDRVKVAHVNPVPSMWGGGGTPVTDRVKFALLNQVPKRYRYIHAHMYVCICQGCAFEIRCLRDIHTYIHGYIYIYIYIYIYTHTHTLICVYVCVCVCTCQTASRLRI